MQSWEYVNSQPLLTFSSGSKSFCLFNWFNQFDHNLLLQWMPGDITQLGINSLCLGESSFAKITNYIVGHNCSALQKILDEF